MVVRIWAKLSDYVQYVSIHKHMLQISLKQ